MKKFLSSKKSSVVAGSERLDKFETRGDILAFARRYIPHYLRRSSGEDIPPADFHREIYTIFASPGRRKRIARAAPRGHAKSTVLSFICVLWAICWKKKKFILLVSDTVGQAEGFLSSIIQEIEGNDLLKKDFGERILPALDPKRMPVKWTDAEIVTAGGVRVAAKGSGSKIRGAKNRETRPDLVIVDDLENDENTNTAEQRKKLWAWFHRALLPALDPDGDCLVVGTIIHFDSLLKNLLDKKGWDCKTLQAIKSDGSLLWPEYWTRERLDKLREELGTPFFESEYQNNPIDPEMQPFKQEWLRYYSPADLVKRHSRLHFNERELTVIMAVDPAISERKQADFSALVTIGYDQAGNIYVLEVIKERLSFNNLLKRITDAYRRWNHKVIIVEEVAFQKAIRAVLNEQGLYPFKPTTPDKDKYRRIIGMAPNFENGKIFLSRGMDSLEEEYLQFPRSSHDDVLDALEMAVSHVKSSSSMFIGLSCESDPLGIGDY